MFDKHFEVFKADTLESKQIHYSIRYQVYCEELGFENKEDFPMEQEFDEYDKSSVHFIVRQKETGDWVGTMRLVISNQQLPMQQHCLLNESLDNTPFRKSAELSRLCVLGKVRKSLAKDSFNKTNSKSQRRANQSIIWGLLNAASEYCYTNNIPNWYFMTTTALQKVLTRGGFMMALIGKPCNHRGERFPFKKDAYDAYHNEKWRNDFINGKAFSKFSEFFGVEENASKVA